MPPEATLLGLMRHTVIAPSETARQLLGLQLPQRTLIEAVALLAVVNGLIAGFPGGVALPISEEETVVIGPIMWSLVLGALTVLSASSIQVVGRLLGGRGSLREALLVTVWINIMGLAVELVALVVGTFSMELATVVLLGGFLFLLWPFVQFVRILHDFSGVARSLLTVVLSGIVASIGFSFILAIALSLGGAPNV